jgi:formylglycine-generating enzyme required for sulfatase activity
MRARAVCAGIALVALAACNAINGSGALSVCGDCGDGADAGLPPRAGPGPGEPGADAGSDGGLPATCDDGDATCAGRVAALCVDGVWQTTSCAEKCVAGACARYPSCEGAAGLTCGASGASCCATADVPGGTFDRRNAEYPATVSPFALDVFEVTVGRFRAFVDAGAATQAAPPPPRAGAHPKIPKSGWKAAWNAELPARVAALESILASDADATWTDAPGDGEQKPINAVPWLEAFAFCAWDGGRLPTYAEWNFAAAGGSEQREYPWSVPPTSTATTGNVAYDCGYDPPSRTCPESHCSDGALSPAVPCDPATCVSPALCVNPPCTGCAPSDVPKVGSFPTGAGRWGHLDLAGSVGELVLDPLDAMPLPCVDCANLPPASLDGSKGPGGGGGATFFLVAGGAFDSTASTALRTSSTTSLRWTRQEDSVGFRCVKQ